VNKHKKDCKKIYSAAGSAGAAASVDSVAAGSSPLLHSQCAEQFSQPSQVFSSVLHTLHPILLLIPPYYYQN
tara:strand:- start:229 stop:444 length:216 start_codon:yes stop_codon:yes gene_type:complete